MKKEYKLSGIILERKNYSMLTTLRKTCIYHIFNLKAFNADALFAAIVFFTETKNCMPNKCMGLCGYLANISSYKLFIGPSSHFRHCRKGINWDTKMQFEVDPKMWFVHSYVHFRKTALAERTSQGNIRGIKFLYTPPDSLLTTQEHCGLIANCLDIHLIILLTLNFNFRCPLNLNFH